MIKSSHIDVRLVPNGVEIVVDDYEIFDYIDDFLTDLGFSLAFSGEEERNGHRWHFMRFEAEATLILDALDGIPLAEVERIWTLNNSGST